MFPTLCVIPGDGVGREVVPAVVTILEAVLPDLKVTEAEAGWAVFERQGAALPPETLDLAKQAGAVLFGAVSSPAYPVEGYHSPIVAMPRALDTFANLRPARSWLVKSVREMKFTGQTTLIVNGLGRND